MSDPKKTTVEKLIDAWWKAREMFNVQQHIDDALNAAYREESNRALAEIVGNLNNFGDETRAREFAGQMLLNTQANHAFTQKKIAEQAKALQKAIDYAENLRKTSGFNYEIYNMYKKAHIASFLKELTAISVAIEGGGSIGGGAIGGGGAGFGITLIVLMLGANSKEAEAKENPPDPKRTQYQEYLLKWLKYAIMALKNNGGKLKSIVKPKTFEQWLVKPGI